MKTCSRLAILLLGLLAQLASADIVLIANKNSELTELNKKQIIDIYMGRNLLLPNGQKAIPLDLSEPAVRSTFYRLLVDKSLNEVNSYWARLLFSGKSLPPRLAESSEEIISTVELNPSVIGYVLENQLTNKNVKIIAHID